MTPEKRIVRAEYWIEDPEFGQRVAWSAIIQYQGADGWLYNLPDLAPEPYHEHIHDRPAADLLRQRGLLYSSAHTGRTGQIVDNVQGG